METRSQAQSLVLSVIMAASGSFILLSIIASIMPALQSISIIQQLAVPGSFLFQSFSVMAFYPAFYLLYNGVLIGRGEDSMKAFLFSSLLFFPMLSLSALLRLIFDASFAQTVIGAWMLSNFTGSSAIMASAITSVVLLMLQLGLGLALTDDNKPEDPAKQKPARPAAKPRVHFLPQRTVSDDMVIPESAANMTKENIASLLQTNMSSFTSRFAEAPAETVETTVLDAMDIEAAVAEVEASEVEASEVEAVEAEVVESTAAEIEMEVVEAELVEVEMPEAELAIEADELEDEVITLNFRGSEGLEPEETETIYKNFDIDLSQDIRALVDIEPTDFLPVDDLPEPELPESPRDFADEISEDDDTDEFVRKLINASYNIPIDGILRQQEKESYWVPDEESNAQSELLRDTLREFGIEAEVTGIRKGPVITMFEILPAPGVKLSRIVNLADNIALSLAATNVRIVAPIPGKHALGIEVPNKHRHLVTFSEILQEDDFAKGDHELPVALGKDITGEAQVIDLTRTPHLLIAGATGAGKSVCVNSLISSLLYRRSPEEVKMILIDPKIVELKFYNDIPHLLTPVITDPKKAFQALQWCLFEMERRYSLLDNMAVRDLRSYNKKVSDNGESLPYIVVVVDEFADLMATSGKELESTLARLAAMSRAVGIHLVLATQRPSTDVITGLIKANIPSRIAFMVASKVDSRIIIDAMGAEKLLGKGDMLLTSAWDPFPRRIQGAYLSEEEVEQIVVEVKKTGSPEYIDGEIFIEDDEGSIDGADMDDPLMDRALEVVYSANRASASYLQRRLSIGYNRAARLIEGMENLGIIGPPNGSKPREVLSSALHQ